MQVSGRCRCRRCHGAMEVEPRQHLMVRIETKDMYRHKHTCSHMFYRACFEANERETGDAHLSIKLDAESSSNAWSLSRCNLVHATNNTHTHTHTRFPPERGVRPPINNAHVPAVHMCARAWQAQRIGRVHDMRLARKQTPVGRRHKLQVSLATSPWSGSSRIDDRASPTTAAVWHVFSIYHVLLSPMCAASASGRGTTRDAVAQRPHADIADKDRQARSKRRDSLKALSRLRRRADRAQQARSPRARRARTCDLTPAARAVGCIDAQSPSLKPCDAEPPPFP